MIALKLALPGTRRQLRDQLEQIGFHVRASAGFCPVSNLASRKAPLLARPGPRLWRCSLLHIGQVGKQAHDGGAQILRGLIVVAGRFCRR
jgi:hypothetical protein